MADNAHTTGRAFLKSVPITPSVIDAPSTAATVLEPEKKHQDWDAIIAGMSLEQKELFSCYVRCLACDRCNSCLIFYRMKRDLPKTDEENLAAVRRCPLAFPKRLLSPLTI